MAMTPAQFHAHALAAADAEGRPPLSRTSYWDIFPFEPDSVARAVEALPHIARAYVTRWGGSCLPMWDDLLPEYPTDLADAAAREVADALVASYGGTATGERP